MCFMAHSAEVGPCQGSMRMMESDGVRRAGVLPGFGASEHKKESVRMECQLEAGTPSQPMVLNITQMPATLECVFAAQATLPRSGND